jgi:hypothetical protein
LAVEGIDFVRGVLVSTDGVAAGQALSEAPQVRALGDSGVLAAPGRKWLEVVLAGLVPLLLVGAGIGAELRGNPSRKGSRRRRR